MKKVIFSVMALSLLTSCSDNDVILEGNDQSPNEMAESFVIPVDSALSYLEGFLSDEIENPVSRSGKKRIVQSVTKVKYNLFCESRSSDDPENLVYVANFENGEGYAILAADSRIEEKVIAVTDNGSLSELELVKAADELKDERVIFEGYPTTGPGFFTVPEFGDEIFLNPNTVELYDATRDDTLVGNFSDDDEGAEDENGNPIKQPAEKSDISDDLFPASLCMTYAISSVDDSKQEHLKPTIDKDKEAPKEDIDPKENITGGGEPSYSKWTTTKTVGPILSKYSNWYQNTPFNDFYPKRRKYIIFGRQRHAPAGCFPLAIAKIMTHFEFPSEIRYKENKVNWKELKGYYYPYYVSDEWNRSAATLLRVVSMGCDCWYFYAGTFTWPKDATAYMRTIGYYNAHSYKYNFERVTEMIDNNSPLIIYSIPGWNIFKSHSWNIDGYKIKQREVTVYKEMHIETMNMVHCSFGWQYGHCNGYYASGVFKLNDKNVEFDSSSDKGRKTHYNNLLKIITYTKPVK